jgi:hypothetical protein
VTVWAVLTADYTEQAPVTNWPARIALVLIVVLLIALALWGMRRGWRNRQARQAWIPAPADAPSPAPLSAPVEGLYIGTATAGDWMDRIAVHDLGVRSRAWISWSEDGIFLERVGARSVFIPRGDVAGVRLDRGVAGTVKAKDSVIVVTWRLGDAVIDTGFRADDAVGHRAVLDGFTSTYHVDVQGVDVDDKENGEPRHA